MLHEFATKLSDRLIDNGADPENKDVLIYGIECALNEIIANLLVFSIAFLIGKPLEMLLWQVFWLPLRINIGGQHAKSHLMCLISSTVLAVGCVLVLPFTLALWWLPFLAVTAAILIAFFFAPFIHPNRLMSDTHRAKVRTRGKIVAVSESAVLTLIFFYSPAWVVQIAALGMLAACALFLSAKIEFAYQSVNQSPADPPKSSDSD